MPEEVAPAWVPEEVEVERVLLETLELDVVEPRVAEPEVDAAVVPEPDVPEELIELEAPPGPEEETELATDAIPGAREQPPRNRMAVRGRQQRIIRIGVLGFRMVRPRDQGTA